MEVSAEETGGDAHAGFGKDNKAFFWIGTGSKPRGGAHVASTPKRAPKLMRSTGRPWPPAAGTTARPAQDPTTISTIRAPSSSILTATTSKRCATGRSEGPGERGLQIYLRLPDTTDFGLVAAAFLVAGRFGAAVFALAFALSTTVLPGGFAG
jgi:hypothetical protein